MFGKLFAKKGSGLTLLLDIGSGSVGSAILETVPGALPKIIFSVREPIKLQKRLHPERLLAQMMKVLDHVISLALKDGIASAKKAKQSTHIDSVFVALNSPWFLSETKTLKLTPMKPTIVTRELISDLVKHEEGEFEKYRDGTARESFRIEEEVTAVVLNGYPVGNPYGKRASEIEVSVYLSFTDKWLMENVRKTMRSRISPNRLSFFSVPYSAFSVISKYFSPDADFVLVDIGREITDVSLVKQGKLAEMYSFPIGKNYLIRHIAEVQDLDPEVARSELVLSFTDKSATAHADKIEKVVKEVRTAWLEAFREATVKLSASHYLPADFYLLSQKDFAPFFSETLGSADIADFSPGKSAPRVHFLGQDELKTLCQYEEGVEADPFLTIESSYVASVLNKQTQ